MYNMTKKNHQLLDVIHLVLVDDIDNRQAEVPPPPFYHRSCDFILTFLHFSQKFAE